MKKWLLTIGSLGAIIAPVAATVACGETEDEIKYEDQDNYDETIDTDFRTYTAPNATPSSTATGGQTVAPVVTIGGTADTYATLNLHGLEIDPATRRTVNSKYRDDYVPYVVEPHAVTNSAAEPNKITYDTSKSRWGKLAKSYLDLGKALGKSDEKARAMADQALIDEINNIYGDITAVYTIYGTEVNVEHGIETVTLAEAKAKLLDPANNVVRQDMILTNLAQLWGAQINHSKPLTWIPLALTGNSLNQAIDGIRASEAASGALNSIEDFMTFLDEVLNPQGDSTFPHYATFLNAVTATGFTEAALKDLQFKIKTNYEGYQNSGGSQMTNIIVGGVYQGQKLDTDPFIVGTPAETSKTYIQYNGFDLLDASMDNPLVAQAAAANSLVKVVA